MCWPQVIAMALSAAGGAIDAREQDKVAANEIRARNDMLNRHNTEQDALAAKSRDTLGNLLTQVNPQGGALQGAQANRDEIAQASITEQTPGALLSGSNAPKIVQSDAASQMREAMKASRAKASANAKLSGFGDQLFNQNLNTQVAGDGIGLNNDFSRASAALLPHYQDLYAVEKYKKPSSIGKLLMSAGNIAGSMGGAGSFGGAGGMSADPWAGLRVKT